MSYSRRQLYAMGEPLGDGATRREVGGKIIYGGGGDSGTPADTTSTVTNELPEWARPYAKEALGKAAALGESEYQVYGGERIAQFSPLQRQSFDRAGGQQVAGQVGLGSGLAGLAGTSSFQDQGTAQGFMSPYMQQVVDQQMASAQRQADIAGTQRGAQAVRAGAFGGSRQAIENAEANRALASQKADIQAKGLQSAFEQAQAQFNAEQGQRLSAAGQLGQLGQQQFGQEMDITGQQQQFGGIQRQATQDLLNTQYQDFLNQQRSPYDQLAFMSSMLRGTPMGGTTAQYQTRAAPSATSQLIGLGTAAAGAYGAAQGQAAGGEVKGYAAGGIASLNQPELAAMAGGMSDQQLGQTAQMPSITDLAKMTLAAEANERARMRQQAMAQQAMAQQQPQGTVAAKEMNRIAALEQGVGSLGDNMPEDFLVGSKSMADGGIVAFQPGGYVPSEENLERQRQEDRQKIQAAYESGLISMEEFGRAIADIATLPLRGVTGAYDSAVVRPMRAAGLNAGYLSPHLVPKGVDPSSMTPFSDKMRAPAASGIASVADGSDNRFARKPMAMGITDQPPAVPTPTPTEKKQLTEGLGAAAPNLGGVGAAPAMPSGGLASLLKDVKTREKQFRDEEAEATKMELEGLGKEREALTKAEEEAKKYGTEQEEKYKKRGERLDKDEKNNIYMTMMEAGFAIAAGESPNALKNLAVGAQQGLKGYQGRLEKVNAGRDDLDEAMFKLHNIRNDKVTAAGDKLRELNRAETRAKVEGQRALSKISEGMFGKQVDLKTKEIDQMYKMWETRYTQSQANERAKIAAETRVDPLTKKDYEAKAELLRPLEMQLNMPNLSPEKRAAVQAQVDKIRAEMAALRGGSGKVTGSSTLPPGFVPD